MNRKLGIQNFRVFDEKGAQFKLAPITVLTGCNSSGKSSMIKAMMLFESFLKDFAGDYQNKKMKPIPSYILELNQGEHKLARFDKSLNKNSKSDEMVFSWSKHSIFANKEIDIQFVFKEIKENKKNKLGNGYLHNIRIISDGKCIYRLRFDMNENEQTYKIDHKAFKELFYDFVNTLAGNNNSIKDLSSNYSIFPNLSMSLNDIYNEIKNLNGAPKSKRFDPAYLYLKNMSYPQHDIFNRFLVSLDGKDLTSNTLFYSPAYKYLKDVNKENINTLLFGKLEGKNVDSYLVSHFESLIDSFIASGHTYFKDFFAEKEKIYLNRNYKKEFGSGFYLLRSHFVHKGGSFINNTINYLKLYSISDGPKTGFNLKFLAEHGLIDSFEKICVIMYGLSDILEPGYSTKNVQIYDKNYDKEGVLTTHKYVALKEHAAWLKYIELFLEDAIFNLPEFLDNVEFINSSRPQVERSYDLSNTGSFNSLLKDYVSYNERNIIYSYEKDYEIGLVEQFYKLGIFVRKWVKELEIGDDIIFETATEGSGIYIYLIYGDEKTLLADLGYGVTQVLSMLLKIELSIIDSFEEGNSTDTIIDGHHTADTQYNRGTTIVIEEPEANLHPKLQSKLADMFMEANEKHNINFILETHSEYLIRKLQYLVASKKLKTENVLIYYLNNPNAQESLDNASQVVKIEIDDDGSLMGDFGSGFFDEATNWKFELMRLKNTQKN